MGSAIKPATYSGPTFWMVLYVLNDIDEDVVYNITKIMYEKTDEIAKSHARGDQIKLENAAKDIAPVPFHPGAVRYHKEKGIPLD